MLGTTIQRSGQKRHRPHRASSRIPLGERLVSRSPLARYLEGWPEADPAKIADATTETTIAMIRSSATSRDAPCRSTPRCCARSTAPLAGGMRGIKSALDDKGPSIFFRAFQRGTQDHSLTFCSEVGRGLVRAPVGGCAMSSDSRDPKQEATEAAQWVAKWRKLEREALGIADALEERSGICSSSPRVIGSSPSVLRLRQRIARTAS